MVKGISKEQKYTAFFHPVYISLHVPVLNLIHYLFVCFSSWLRSQSASSQFSFTVVNQHRYCCIQIPLSPFVSLLSRPQKNTLNTRGFFMASQNILLFILPRRELIFHCTLWLLSTGQYQLLDVFWNTGNPDVKKKKSLQSKLTMPQHGFWALVFPFQPLLDSLTGAIQSHR